MRWLSLLAAVTALAACDSGTDGSTSGTGSSSGGAATSGGSTGGGTSTGGGASTGGTTGSGGAAQIELCTTENGTLSCLSQDPHLAITFPAGPVGSLIGPARIDVSDLSPVPLTVTAVTLDAAAISAGYSIVETNLGLPKVLSTTTGLTLPFHIVLMPTSTCASSGCLKGSVSVQSSDPHYSATDPPSVGLIGTGT